MSLFDLAAGLVLVVSAIVGWIRGASREVATVAAIIIAAIVAIAALRFTGGIARHAIHTPWLANIAAILIVFAAVYILLRVMAGALTRRIQQTRGLGGVDRTVGAGFGVARALVILGLANLTLNAITPPDRMPAWISGAMLYPVSAVSAKALKAFAPRGADLAKKALPVVGNAITNSGGGDDQTQDDNGAPASPDARPETTP
jgi:membrane protein required for colicin V production